MFEDDCSYDNHSAYDDDGKDGDDEDDGNDGDDGDHEEEIEEDEDQVTLFFSHKVYVEELWIPPKGCLSESSSLGACHIEVLCSLKLMNIDF